MVAALKIPAENLRIKSQLNGTSLYDKGGIGRLPTTHQFMMPSPMHDVTPNAVAIAERAATTTLMMVLHNIFLESSIMLIFLKG